MKQLYSVSFLCAIALLAAPGSARFDYYVLSLSWAPQFCAQPGEAAANPLECGSPKGFVVHGLWPEANSGNSPESCGAAKTVPKSLVNQMLKYIPSASLIQHEWATHGTCTGLSQGDYFTQVMLARAAIQIPVQISSLGQATTESPTEVESQFAGANPSFPDGGFRTACRNGQLTEVRACFSKELKPQACTVSVGECSSPSVTILSPQ
jgi:ribonuclease T2